MKKETIYALGFFDGVHLGHQALLRTCKQLAQRHSCNAGVVTFTAHPDTLVSGKAPALLNTIEDRNTMLRAYGMDTVFALPFDRTVMTTHWASFLTQLVQAGAAGFVCGDDFRFGAGGSGTAKKLAAFCEKRALPFAVVPGQIAEGERISSTRIRALLENGQVEQANRLLGHPHILTGVVTAGKQLGRTMGFPTANLLIPEGVLVPRLGVYACKATVEGKQYPAVTNIGTRPTVSGEGVIAETHLLDFDGDLYGKVVKLAFYQFLRPEQKFDSLAQLQEEIQKNTLQTRYFFGKSE